MQVNNIDCGQCGTEMMLPVGEIGVEEVQGNRGIYTMPKQILYQCPACKKVELKEYWEVCRKN